MPERGKRFKDIEKKGRDVFHRTGLPSKLCEYVQKQFNILTLAVGELDRL